MKTKQKNVEQKYLEQQLVLLNACVWCRINSLSTKLSVIIYMSIQLCQRGYSNVI